MFVNTSKWLIPQGGYHQNTFDFKVRFPGSDNHNQDLLSSPGMNGESSLQSPLEQSMQVDHYPSLEYLGSSRSRPDAYQQKQAG